MRLTVFLSAGLALLLIAAVHSQSASPGRLRAGGGVGQGPPTAKTVADALVEPITAAKAKLAPARIGFGTTRVDLNVNRDLFNRPPSPCT